MSLSDQLWCPASAQVTVLQARGLRIKGKGGTNDAYAVMQVGKEKYQTSVVEKSVAPVWKEEATFDLPQQQQQRGGGGGGGGTERSTLHVHVLHRALVGPDKLLGQAVINLLQLSEDRTRNKTEWFKLLDKTGKADKDRGEVLVDIQFMRNNMTASMFDLSAAGKSRSRLGKFKDKVRGKKKESDTVSTIVPSFTQVLTDSEEEGNEDAEAAAGKDEKKKKHKMKSLFSPKSNLQKNMSQSMSVLPGKNSPLSGSQSSGLNVDPSEGKKKFKFKIHKRSGSSDNKESSSSLQKHGTTEQSNMCINGSHVYCEEPPARTSRIGSNFSLASSGHGSMEDVPDSSPPSVDSLRGVRQYSPWTEEEEEMAEVENIKEDVEEERITMEEEEERRRQEEEVERLAEEKRKQERRRIEEEEEERIRIDEERAQEERRRREEKQRLAEEKRRLEEERIQREEEERSRREEEERARREEEERERLAEEKRRLEEEERSRIKEVEKRQREEEERIRMEEERAKEERRRQEEERKLAEEKKRLEEEERRMIEEEEIRRIEEQERRRIEEEERIRMEEEMAQEQRRREEEENAKRQEEERKLAEQKRRLEEEEKRQREEEEKRQREEEEKRQREEEERISMEEERRRQEEEERVKRQEEEHKLAEEKKRLEEEERRKLEEEEVRKEEEERIRREEEDRRRQEEGELVRRLEEEREEKRRLEGQERKRMEEEERIKKEEEEKARKEKEEYERVVAKKRKLEEEERKRIEAEEKIRKEEEERVRAEEDWRRKEEERRQEEEQEKLAEEKRIMEEQERRIREEKQREEEERIRKEEERRHQEEERKRIVEEERSRQEEQERIRMEKERRSREAEEDQSKMEEEEKARKLEKVTRNAEERKKRENKTKQEVAGMKSKVGSPAEVCSTNPFDEDFSNNPFDENPNSPDSTTVSAVHQRSQPAVSSVGSKTSSTDEKDLISSQREKRLAPQPPGRNQAEGQSQREQDGSTRHLVQVNKQSKDKDSKTVSAPLQRSVHMIAPLSRPLTDTKNPQSLAQSKGKRPAPSAPAEPKKASSSGGKIANRSSSEAKQEPIAYGLNPFEDDEDENEPTAQDTTGSIRGPPAVSHTADGDAACQAKIQSSKKARAPLLPATTAATSSTSINQSTEGGHDTSVTTQDDGLTHPCDPEEAPVQESQSVMAVAQEAGGKKEVPPVTSRRLQPVKPLNPLGQQPVSVAQGEMDNKSTGIQVQEKTKANDTELKGPFSQLTQEELISLVLKQDKQLSERDKKICELEQYIDNLLVRVMEESPSILMSMNALKKAV